MRQAGFTTATTKTKPPRGSQSQQHIKPRAQTQIPIPFGATQGRSEEREHEIKRKVQYGVVSFAPRRPPRRGDPSVKDLAVKGRPTSVPEEKAIPTVMESCWLDHARKHLTRKELVPHVSSNSIHGKKHTPWTEFCKCLHLFASGILNKEELVLLLKGLFVQGHAPKGERMLEEVQCTQRYKLKRLCS